MQTKYNLFLKWCLLGIYRFVGTDIAFFKNIGRILSVYLVVILILFKIILKIHFSIDKLNASIHVKHPPVFELYPSDG